MQSDDRRVGSHTIRYAAPDLIHLTMHGELTAAEVRDLIQESYRVMNQHGSVFTLLDATHLERLSQEARRAAHQMLRAMPPFRGSTAVFGASTPLRLLFTLLMNALRLFTGRANEEMAFFKDRDAALAWLQERRSALTGTSPSL